MTVHRCHLPGCETPTPRQFLFCPPHWRRVPKAIQREVWAAYHEAGGSTGSIERVTDRWLAAVKAAEASLMGVKA